MVCHGWKNKILPYKPKNRHLKKACFLSTAVILLMHPCKTPYSLTPGIPEAYVVFVQVIPLALPKMSPICCKTLAAEVLCALQTEQAGLPP